MRGTKGALAGLNGQMRSLRSVFSSLSLKTAKENVLLGKFQSRRELQYWFKNRLNVYLTGFQRRYQLSRRDLFVFLL